MSQLEYRPNVGIMVINKQGKIWVGKRIPRAKHHDMIVKAWQMPQGGVDAGEDLEAAARRELYEETGIKNITLLAKSDNWITYDLPEQLIGKVLKGNYKGQAQMWYCYQFNGNDSEINLHPTNEKPEFCEWKWVDIDTLNDLIVEFKQQVYKQVVKQFRKFAQPIK